MSDHAPLKKPAQPMAKTRKSNAADRARYCETAPFRFPTDDYMQDHMLHGAVARVAGGLSPISLALAGFDWWAHLAFSPAKQRMLRRSLMEKAATYVRYTAAAATDAEAEPAIEPAPADKRFKGEGWQAWPFNAVSQGFLMWESWWQEATSGVRGVEKHHEDIVAFTARQWLDMWSPSNFPLANPEILKTTLQRHGRNFVDGMLNWADDAARVAGDMPPAGTEAFAVGENIAITPGKIIYRNHLIELIQYEPVTAEVYREPVLIVPAWIMKYYILDLSPHNSMVKYLVGKGHTVFMISWRNPDACDRELGMEDYLESGLGEALHVVRGIAEEKVHAVGYCLGGTLLSIMAAKLGRDGGDPLASITLFAAQTDFEEAGEISLFVDESQVSYLEDVMWNQGYLDKFQMAGAFQMLRSNDLIWSRVISEYMQGKRNGMNDLMAWNADATRMPYRMHSEYLRQLFMQNDLAEGRFIVGDAPIVLRDITLPAFVVGTVRDHIAPWRSVFKFHLLSSSDITFVLASGGHNAGIVSEPGHEGRSYQIKLMPHAAPYMPPGQWQKSVPVSEGSWWEPWQQWLAGHSTGKRKALKAGDRESGYPSLGDAPGGYVMMK